MIVVCFKDLRSKLLDTSAKPEIARFSSAPQDGENYWLILEIFAAGAIMAK